LARPKWCFQTVALTRLFQKITESKQSLGENVNRRIYYGIKTGLNDAFIINNATRFRLINEHSSSAEIIKPMLRLEPKPDNWEGNWRGRKAGPYKWYEIQDNVAYYQEFEKPKIVWLEAA
jgi:adenine-specific DNA-methyltransferase